MVKLDTKYLFIGWHGIETALRLPFNLQMPSFNAPFSIVVLGIEIALPQWYGKETQ